MLSVNTTTLLFVHKCPHLITDSTVYNNRATRSHVIWLFSFQMVEQGKRKCWRTVCVVLKARGGLNPLQELTVLTSRLILSSVEQFWKGFILKGLLEKLGRGFLRDNIKKKSKIEVKNIFGSILMNIYAPNNMNKRNTFFKQVDRFINEYYIV
jgi:hypothetical protein